MSQLAANDNISSDVFGETISQGVRIKPLLIKSSLKYPAKPYQLVPFPRGSLSSLVAQPLTNLVPKLGQVLLQVLAVGVNFRDVLNVLGMYPGDPGNPGGDVAGIVVDIGPGVNFRLLYSPLCSITRKTSV